MQMLQIICGASTIYHVHARVRRSAASSKAEPLRLATSRAIRPMGDCHDTEALHMTRLGQAGDHLSLPDEPIECCPLPWHIRP